MTANIDDRRRSDFEVAMKSRPGKTFRVRDRRDKEFLELADKFIIEARQVQKDPKRRRPRLGFGG